MRVNSHSWQGAAVLCHNPMQRCQSSTTIYDLLIAVAFGHNKLWQPKAANKHCDLSNVVAFGHNELWRPKAAKVSTKLAKKAPIDNADPMTCCS